MTQVNVNCLLPLAISGQKYSYLYTLNISPVFHSNERALMKQRCFIDSLRSCQNGHPAGENSLALRYITDPTDGALEKDFIDHGIHHQT